MKLLEKQSLPFLRAIILWFALSSCFGSTAASTLRYSLQHIDHDTVFAHRIDLSGEWQLVGENGTAAKIFLPQFLSGQAYERYHHQFKLAHTEDRDLFLLFERMDSPFSVYIDEKFVGGGNGNGLPASLPVPAELLGTDSSHHLMLEVDSRLQAHHSLPLQVRMRGLPVRGKGIYRTMKLFALRKPYLAAVELRLPANNADDWQVRLIWKNDRPITVDQRCYAAIDEIQTAKTVWQSFLPIRVTGDTTEIVISRTKLQTWTPSNPHRYRLRVELRRDGSGIYAGEVAFAQRDTGNLVFKDNWIGLQAIQWVEDLGVKQAPADSALSRFTRDMMRIRSLGGNAVHPFADIPSSRMVEVCDELGLAILPELPLQDVPTLILLRQDFQKRVEQALLSMIVAFRHHPSICAWGVGEGLAVDDPQVAEWLSRLCDQAATIDSRPLFLGVQKMPSQTDERLIYLVSIDQISPGATQWVKLEQPLRGDGKTDEHSVAIDQALCLTHELLLLRTHESARGLVIGPLRDWRGDLPHLLWGPTVDNNLFRAGLFDQHDHPRPAASVCEAHFRQQKYPTLIVTEGEKDEPILFVLIGLFALVLFLLLLKNDRRYREYLRRIFLFPHGFYIDLMENRQVNFPLTLITGVINFLLPALIIASAAFYARTQPLFDHFLSWLFKDPDVKYRVIWLIWKPQYLIPLLTIGMLSLAILQSLLIKFIVVLQRRSIRLRQIVAFCLWLPSNLLFLFPLSIAVFRTLERQNLHLAVAIAIILVLLWLFLRMLRGLRVMLQYSVGQMFLLFLFLGAAVAVLGMLLERNSSFISYIKYFFS